VPLNALAHWVRVRVVGDDDGDDGLPPDPPNLWMELVPLPIAVALTLGVKQTALGRILIDFLIQVTVHEFGHAVTAWLCGIWALPLPCLCLTYVGMHRSMGTYAFLAILLVGFGWLGLRFGRFTPLVIATLFLTVQAYMTFGLSDKTAEMLVTHGGCAGELWISSLMIIAFFVKLPDRWRWDFWRFPTMLFGCYGLVGSWWMWRAIATGRMQMPWGTANSAKRNDPDGDLNRLVNKHDWTAEQLVDNYLAIAAWCIGAVVAVYLINGAWVVCTHWMRRRASEAPATDLGENDI